MGIFLHYKPNCNIRVMEPHPARLMYMTPKQETQLQTVLSVAHDRYKKALDAYAFFKVHNDETREDLVQDTFMKTWVYLIKGGKIELMKAFLYHVLNDLIIDEYRKQKTVSLDTMLEKGFEPPENKSDGERLLNVLDGKAAFLLIHRLPVKYRQVMRMRYIQGLSLKEISTLTGQTKNTVAVQTHRGLRKLKALYGNMEEK